MQQLERIVHQRVDSGRSAGIVAAMVFADGRTRVVAYGDAGGGRRLDKRSYISTARKHGHDTLDVLGRRPPGNRGCPIPRRPDRVRAPVDHSQTMSQRSRRPNKTQRRQLPAARPTAVAAPTTADRERLLLDQIADGELDHSLHALADAVHARLHLLHTVQAATALAQLCIGDEVRLNHTVKPRYLHGVHGEIIDIDDRDVTVCLHRPIGRFTSGHVRCSALALDRLSPAPTTKVA